MLDKPNAYVKLGLGNIFGKCKRQWKLIIFFTDISEELVIHDHLTNFGSAWRKKKKIQYNFNSTERLKIF